MRASFTKLPPEQEAIRAKCFHPTGTFVEFPIEEIATSIPERFAKIARQFSNHVAVKCDGQVVTYEELDDRSNHIAHAILNETGAGPEPIGLLFDLSIALLIAMLGTLKAGKIIVLLSPRVPVARGLAVLTSSRAGLIVADDANMEHAKQLSEGQRAILAFTTVRAQHHGFDLPSLNAPAKLAFLAYTSGSTGDPKGVIQGHRNILHNVMLRTNLYRISPCERIAVPRSGTSGAVINMFLALLNGGGCYLFDTQREGSTHLARWLSEEQATFLSVSMSLFRQLSESMDRKDSALRVLQFGSQSVHRSDVELFKTRFPQESVLFNLLSSTETGPIAAYAMDAAAEIVGDDVPVGFPLRDKEICLQGDTGKQLDDNEIGEIVVRSRYLSNGYWNREDLTAAKFQRDPHDPEMGLYYSGDLGIRLPDGCLIHKGRKDFRVKIRGYSVELAEVEKSLRQHPSIKDAIVLARKNELREASLLTYVSTRTESRLSVAELRRFLMSKLPEYMIPSVFVMRHAMPLTPNGKIDRQALGDPGDFRPELDTPYVAPQTPVEKDLVKIWAEMLKLDRIGIHDKFFDLGGHSLAAMGIVSQVLRQFQIELPLQALFDAPTIAQMAKVIETREDNQANARGLERLLDEVEAMSEDEARKLVDKESKAREDG